MTFYVVIIVLIIIGIYNFDYKEKRIGKKTYYLFLLIIFISLAGFRFEVGGDTIRYMRGFRNLFVGATMDSIEMTDKYQPLSVLIIGGTKLLGGEFWVVQFIYAFIFNVTIFWFINQYSYHKYICLFIYFIFFYPKLNFEILRESLAIAFFMVGFVYLNRGRTWVYWLCFIGAFLSHISGLFMLFFLIIRKLPNSPLWIGIYIIISFGLSFFSDTIISRFSGIGNIDGYVNYQSSIFGKIGVLIKAVIFPLLVYYIASHRNLSITILKALKLYPLVGCAELVIFILYRYENYMAPIMIVALGSIIYYIPRTKSFKRLINSLVVVVFALLVYISPYFTSINSNQYIPYYEFWVPYYSILDSSQDTGRRALMSLYDK